MNQARRSSPGHPSHPGLPGLLLLLALAGCRVDIPDGAACAQDTDCPEGQRCDADRRCRKMPSGGGGTAGGAPAAGGVAGGAAGGAAGGIAGGVTAGGTTAGGSADSGVGQGEARTAMGCFDGIDNDMDGQTDCDDPDCEGFTCRPSLGVCDPAESCAMGECVPDVKAPPTQPCRQARGDCDAEERCDGMSAACPTDVLRQMGSECRAAMGPCDVAETCTGSSADCPVDGFAPSTQTCGRAGSGECDVDDVCPGNSALCPDRVRARGAVCRVPSGACDVAETCDGTSTDCPVDAFIDAGVQCRPVDGGCDVSETCTGAAAECPPDGVRGLGDVCRTSQGACDVEEVCDGVSRACPMDVLRAANVVCRPASDGGCDLPEVCTGGTPECPVDRFANAGTTCRPAATACDGVERCTGSGVCPDDISSCPGQDDFCDGNTCAPRRMRGAACTTNDQCVSRQCARNGICCDSACGRFCEECSADGRTCQPRSTAVQCRPALDSCDVPDFCSTTVRGDCPTDTRAPPGTLCRPSDGGCDAPELCPADGGVCPNDSVLGSSSVCRAIVPGNTCDVAEFCSGSSKACPPDRFVDAGVVCRPAANGCDVAEVCAGNTASCQADRVRDAGTACGLPTCMAGTLFPVVCQSSMPPPVCSGGATVSCGGYQCNMAGTGCLTSCLSNAQCLTSHYCSGTMCLPKKPDGQVCSSAQECINGDCTDYFLDQDIDGFGRLGTMTQKVCNNGTTPRGFSKVNTDCCDVDPDVRPNQTGAFSEPSSCRSFDYNCDGQATPTRSVLYSCAPLASCRNGWASAVPACGADGTFRTCTGGALCSTPVSMMLTQFCR